MWRGTSLATLIQILMRGAGLGIACAIELFLLRLTLRARLAAGASGTCGVQISRAVNRDFTSTVLAVECRSGECLFGSRGFSTRLHHLRLRVHNVSSSDFGVLRGIR